MASYITQDNWTILSSQENEIKNKLDKYGKKLKDWNIRINYGIKTGLNEAFIIDSNKKDELIKEDPRSAAIIRPILRGRDIKRFDINYADLYVIATFPSKRININDYPAIKKYLLSFDKRVLSQSGEKNIDGIEGKNARKKTGNKWFETQDQINYSDDFFRPKIMWAELARTGNSFIFDKEQFFCIAGAFIMTFKDCEDDKLYKYLLAILNHPTTLFYFDFVYSKLDETGWQWKKEPIEKVSIFIPNQEQIESISSMVDDIYENKKDRDKIYKLNLYIFKMMNMTKDEVTAVYDRIKVFSEQEESFVIDNY